MFTGHYGIDGSLSDPNRPALSRGVPIRKAIDQNNLIVWAMNGEPLSNIHGGPVRLIIPGWPGSVSSKWLTRIWVRDKVHDGPGMGGTSYRVAIKPMIPGGKPDENNFRDLESMPVRSIITSPANGTKLAGNVRELNLRGAAWDGDLVDPARRRVGRLRCDLAAGAIAAGEEPLRLAALDRDGAGAERGLLRDLDAGDRPARHRCSRTSPATGIRRAMAPIRCTGSRC